MRPRPRSGDAARIQQPSFLSRRFDPSQLLGHFVLGRSVPLEPDGWHRLQMDQWTLLHDPRLPVIELADPDGSALGWVLGHPIDLQSEELVTGPLRAPLRERAGTIGAEFEDWLYRFGGRFAVIVVRPKPSVYPDAVATLPVLFSEQLQCVASSPFLLSSPDEPVPDGSLVGPVAVCERNLYFPFGTTPHAHARLLLAHHVLDLTHWAQTRIWPAGPLEPDDPAALSELLAAVVHKTLTAVATAGRPSMSLTAGRDTRLFLACSRDVIDRIRFFTVAFPDDLGAIDLATAPAIARRFGFDYQMLPWIRPSNADIELFMYRTGCLVGERRGRMAGPTYNQLGGRDVYVSGGCSPAGRWGRRPTDDETLRLEPLDLLSRYGFPPHPELIRHADEWLAALPEGLGGLDTLSLFYYEMRGGVWAGSLTMAYPEAYTFTLYPYAHRSLVEAELRLPWRCRHPDFVDAAIASRSPELLGIPINRVPAGVAAGRKIRYAGRLAKAGLARRNWRKAALVIAQKRRTRG